jgi:branched-chain amino acid transport system substrate-binding protein
VRRAEREEVVQENNVDALIGPSTTPNRSRSSTSSRNRRYCLATVGTSAVVELIDAKKRWVFKTTQNDDPIAAAP